jgi:hypothetical protein
MKLNDCNSTCHVNGYSVIGAGGGSGSSSALPARLVASQSKVKQCQRTGVHIQAGFGLKVEFDECREYGVYVGKIGARAILVECSLQKSGDSCVAAFAGAYASPQKWQTLTLHGKARHACSWRRNPNQGTRMPDCWL